jgi:signal transduction histidine kinase
MKGRRPLECIDLVYVCNTVQLRTDFRGVVPIGLALACILAILAQAASDRFRAGEDLARRARIETQLSQIESLRLALMEATIACGHTNPGCRAAEQRLTEMAAEVEAQPAQFGQDAETRARVVLLARKAVAEAGAGVPGRALKELSSLSESLLRKTHGEMERAETRNLRTSWVILVGGALTMAALLIGVASLSRSLGETRNLLAQVSTDEHRYMLLAQRVEEAREGERAALARAIHDEIGQVLTAIKMDISSALRDASVQDPSVSQRLSQASALADEGVRIARRISLNLRPAILDQMGLWPALEWLSREFEERTGIPCTCTAPGEPSRLAPPLELAVFRIAQEALTNVTRHAKASRVFIGFKASASDVTIDIIDDGIGFDLGLLKNYRSIGLAGMQERARLAGAQFEIHSASGTGTTVRVVAPFPLLSVEQTTC